MADGIVEKRGRGRPKGTGGNKRPDKSDAMSVHMEPGENRKYITHSLRMWDWETPDMKEPAQVKERIGQYLEICAEDDMKPSVAGMALAFGVHRKTLWAWANGIDSDYLPPASRDLIKKSVSIFERTDGRLRTERKGQPCHGNLPDEEPFWLCGQAGGRVDTQPAARRSGSRRGLGEEVPRRCGGCVQRL